MLDVTTTIKSITYTGGKDFFENLFASDEPVILRKLVSSWPAVQAATESQESIHKYLLQFYQGADVLGFFGQPEDGGRIFFDESFSGFNYKKILFQLDDALKKLAEFRGAEKPPTLYIGSTSVDQYLPGFRSQNDLPLDHLNPFMGIWLCNRSRIAAHWDNPPNIACCVSGRRRFTLFPFSQMDNLYVGPLDKTPAGQAISLVDFHEPDFEKHPKFREALKHAQTAELEPGDALYIPGMWWHHVESLDSLNILVNYWMSDYAQSHGNAIDAMYHAILAIRELPEKQRNAWKMMFDRYVFDFDEETIKHIPDHAKGVLGSANPDWGRRIRAYLISQLNR